MGSFAAASQHLERARGGASRVSTRPAAASSTCYQLSRGVWTVAELCGAAARPWSRRRAGASERNKLLLVRAFSLLGEAPNESHYYTAMTLQTRLLCLVRIPLEPEEREQPERDGKTS